MQRLGIAHVAQMCHIDAMTSTALRTEMVRARIEPRRKRRAEAILDKLGIQPSQAINMLYAQIELMKALPFDLRVPTRKTKGAMKAVCEGRTHKAKNVADLFRDLDR